MYMHMLYMLYMHMYMHMCRRYCMEESVEGEARVYPGRTRCRAPMGDP